LPKTCLKLNARINRLRAIRARDAQRARDAATAHVARVADIAAELLQQAVGEASV
jgi:DNA-binding FadR family transcriptional regulator